MMAVLDTSVIIKWFDLDEDDSNKAGSLLTAANLGDIQVVLPHFTQLEVANILRLGKKFPEEKTKDCLINFLNLEPNFVEINRDYLLEISRLSYAENIASYDASFVIVADQHNIPLFTADYKHHQKSISKNIVWLKEWKGKL